MDNFRPPLTDEDGDWLSCCISGKNPEIEVQGSGWPNKGTYATLEPNIKLPQWERGCEGSSECLSGCTSECLSNYTNDTALAACISGCSNSCTSLKNCTERCLEKNYSNGADLSACIDKCMNCKDFSCNETYCPGYECIYTYENEFLGAGDKERPPGLDVDVGPVIWFEKTIEPAEPDHANYKILVKNNGETMLHDVKVVDILPLGLNFTYSGIINQTALEEANEEANKIVSLEASESEINAVTNRVIKNTSTSIDVTWKEPSKAPDGTAAQNLTWELGTMMPGETTYIFIYTTIDGDTNVDTGNNWAYAEGIYKAPSGDETIRRDPVKAKKP